MARRETTARQVRHWPPWGWYYLRLERPIRIILQTPADPIVATLRAPDPDKGRAAPAEVWGSGRTQ